MGEGGSSKAVQFLNFNLIGTGYCKSVGCLRAKINYTHTTLIVATVYKEEIRPRGKAKVETLSLCLSSSEPFFQGDCVLRETVSKSKEEEGEGQR